MKIVDQLRVVRLMGLGVSFLLILSACGSAGTDTPAPEKTDESISCVINGKAYSSYSAASLSSDTSLGLVGLLPLTSDPNSQFYGVQFFTNKLAVGTYSVQNGGVIFDFNLVKSLSSADKYTISSGTVTVSQYDAKGYAEGTFALAGKGAAGQAVDVTNGKFRIDMR